MTGDVIPVWLEVTAGLIIGLGLIGGVFWFTFAPMPERRDDSGTNTDADYALKNAVENLEPPGPENMNTDHS